MNECVSLLRVCVCACMRICVWPCVRAQISKWIPFRNNSILLSWCLSLSLS